MSNKQSLSEIKATQKRVSEGYWAASVKGLETKAAEESRELTTSERSHVMELKRNIKASQLSIHTYQR